MSDYNAYLKEKETVNIKLSEIEKYNQDHQNYQDDLDSYNQYLLDVQEYSKKVEDYKTYLDDKYAYDQIKSEIDAQVEAYNKDMQLVNYQFASMDLFYNSDLYPNITPEKTIYKCLYTDAVAQVTNPDNAWILSAGAGVPESIFTSAASATNKLKKILTEYKDKYLIDKNGNYVLDDGGQKILKTDADNYKLYIKYFNSLYTNVTKLTKFLEFLFTNTNIRNEMDSRGKTEKYKDLLSELIYISNLFTYPNNLTAYNNTTKTIGFDYNLGGQTVCERLGLAVPTIEKKMQPLSSYPVDPAVVYGTEPSITDEKYGLSDDDFENNEIKKVTEVTKPIEPLLSDYGLTQNDLEWTFLKDLIASKKLSLCDLVLENGEIILDREEFVYSFGENFTDRSPDRIYDILIGNSLKELILNKMIMQASEDYIKKINTMLATVEVHPMIEQLADLLAESISETMTKYSSYYGSAGPGSMKIGKLVREAFPPCIAHTVDGVSSGGRNDAIVLLLTSFVSYARLYPGIFASEGGVKVSDIDSNLSIVMNEILPLIYEAADNCTPPLFEDQPQEKINITSKLGFGMHEVPDLENEGETTWYTPMSCEKIQMHLPQLCKKNKDCQKINNPLSYYSRKRWILSKEGKIEDSEEKTETAE